MTVNWSAFASYYDYGWFIALLAWTAAGVVGRRLVRDQPGWQWLPWAAWTGAVNALIELVSFAWPLRNIGPVSVALGIDLVLGIVTAIGVAGWIWSLPISKGLRAGAIFLVIAASLLRLPAPAEGAVFIALAGMVVAIVWRRKFDGNAHLRLLTVVALGVWAGSSGPFASSGLQLRRAVSFGEWSPVWSFTQAAVAVTVLTGVLAPWFASRERREWQVFFFGCVAWLIAGLGLAAVMSSAARKNFEQQAVARAQMAAALMNKTALRELLGPNFKVIEVQSRTRPGDGSVLRQARVPLLNSGGYEVQHQLALIGKAGGNDGYFATIEVPHSGWMASITPEGYSSNPLKKDKRDDRVGLNPQGSDDLIDWIERRARFLPLLQEGRGRAHSIVNARAPLVGEGGQMLGWLMIEFPRAQWISAQIETRLQAYVIVALGFLLAALLAVHRLRTQEREMARAVASAATQADHLKTAFLAKVSHELRTPIQSVLGYGELLEGALESPVARRRLAALRSQGELMLRLVNDLLDLSAIQAGAFRLKPNAAPLADLARQTVESLRPRAESKGLALALEIRPQVPAWATIDRERVRQIFLNLVGNAIKFTDSGRVDITLEAGSKTDEVRLVVADTGPGISASERAQLFRPFGRLPSGEKKEGSGLGLALTVGLCRSMGGDVVVESEVERGTTFIASFQAPSCVANLPETNLATRLPLHNRRVLVVDDNQLVRELFVEGLEEAGARCTTANDGNAALLTAAQQEFDVMVLDLSMPGLGGVEVAQRLREAKSRVRIVGVSAHAGEAEKAEALAAGMDIFLVKPVRLDDLISSVAPEEKFQDEVAGSPLLLSKLRARFRGVAKQEGMALAEAVQRGDFKAAHLRAHHLMNSAAVVRDDRLFLACSLAETEAKKQDGVALEAAWRECAAALIPWMSDSLSPEIDLSSQPSLSASDKNFYASNKQ